MQRRTILLAYLLMPIFALASEFRQPWNDNATALIIDPYSGNSIVWDALKGESRVIAIIHKATIGMNKIDDKYFARMAEAKRRGYLWGSYHWGVAGNPVGQADCYLDTVKPSDDDLIALDLEDVHSKTLMNADEALIFIKRIKERTGRYPVLYTNHENARYISDHLRDPEFKETPLWYARFKPAVTDFPKGVWVTYSIWQFSSEILPQLAVPGTRKDMDINVYNGTIEQLKAKWPLTKKPN